VVRSRGCGSRVTKREGVSSSIRRSRGSAKRRARFRVLQTPWHFLRADVEPVDRGGRSRSLQHGDGRRGAGESDGESAIQDRKHGAESVPRALPTRAENVKISGDQVADCLVMQNSEKEGSANVGGEAEKAGHRAVNFAGRSIRPRWPRMLWNQLRGDWWRRGICSAGCDRAIRRRLRC